MNRILVVEDDPDIQALIEAIFSMDKRFAITLVTESAEDAVDALPTSLPQIIVLDHGLAGERTGLEVAQELKRLAPKAKIIMFTAHAEIETQSERESTIDAFVLKTEATRLLPLAQLMTRTLGFA